MPNPKSNPSKIASTISAKHKSHKNNTKNAESITWLSIFLSYPKCRDEQSELQCRDIRLEHPMTPSGSHASSNRSVVEPTGEPPADRSTSTSPPPDPNGVTQPHKYKNSKKNKKFHLLGRTFFNFKTSHNILTIKTIQIISCL